MGITIARAMEHHSNDKGRTKMTMATTVIAAVHVLQVGPAAQVWQLINMDQATTGVCWSFSDLFEGVI
jgi:hypothetical protein